MSNHAAIAKSIFAGLALIAAAIAFSASITPANSALELRRYAIANGGFNDFYSSVWRVDQLTGDITLCSYNQKSKVIYCGHNYTEGRR